MPKDWAPLVYCWRGGKRSGTLTGCCARSASTPAACRRLQGVPARVNAELPQLAQRFRYVTLRLHRHRQDRAADCIGRCRGTGD